MPAYTQLGQSSAVKTDQGKMSAALDLRGLDLTTPADLISNGRTPYAKNFRLYAQQADDRQVAVSSRKGPGFHTAPIAEMLSDSVQGSVGASSAEVGLIHGIHAIPLQGGSQGRITRIDLEVADTHGASGPLMVQIYEGQDGLPTRLLSESSILGGAISETPTWQSARFVNAPLLETGKSYWLVIVMQDDGKKTYDLSTTTEGTPAWVTNSALSQIEQQDYAVKYRVYTTPDGKDKGAYRFARDNGDNKTLVAYGTSMYVINEATGELRELLPGLAPEATDYRFTNGDNKVFWVNSYDELTAWNGEWEDTAENKVLNGNFPLGTTNWTAFTGTTLGYNATEGRAAPGSMRLTAASGVRGATQTLALYKNRRYKVTFWAKAVTTASGNMQLHVNNSTTPVAASVKPLTTAWQMNEFYWTPGDDITSISIRSTLQNMDIDDVSIVDTGIEYIRDTELGTLSDIIMHKNQLFGVDAADPNRLVFSESPGVPAYNAAGTVPKTAREQWYYEWLSVSFIYVPRPHNGSPITSLTSFQDSLIITTQDNKYTLGGHDRGSFFLRQSTGNKGALSRRGVTSDENTIVLIADDGIYTHNGSSDEKISTLIAPLFDACPRKEEMTPIIWKNQIRVYMASQGSPVNDMCLVFMKDIGEWGLDTDTYVNRAVYYDDADDNNELIEFSSLVPVSYIAEQNYHSLGAPIDFEYRLKYDSMGSPMQRKRLKRFYPILQGVDSSYTLQLAMDKDFENSPKIKEQLLTTNSAKIGEFKFGDGTIFGSDTSFKPKRQSYSGYAHYWQLRVIRKGVNNRVAFIGAQFSYKTKRL